MGTVQQVQYKKGGSSHKITAGKSLGGKIQVKKLVKKLSELKEKMRNNFTERCSEIQKFSKGLANSLTKNFTLEELKFIKKKIWKKNSSF